MSHKTSYKRPGTDHDKQVIQEARSQSPRMTVYVDSYPEITAHALKSKRLSVYAAWMVLKADQRERDNPSHIDLPLADTITLLSHTLGVSRRQARQIITDGTGTYWTLGDKRVWVRGPAGIAKQLDIERVSTPQQIPLADLTGKRSRRRAALMAAVAYDPGADARPVTRRRVEELTGVPRSTQKRYEKHGHAVSLGPTHVKLSHVQNEGLKRAILSNHKAGFYRGSNGDLMRRHGDRRQATTHLPGNPQKAKHVNARLRKTGHHDRANKARKEQPWQSYFQGRDGATRFVKAKHALGKNTPMRQVYDPVFDYAVIASVGKQGTMVFESAVVEQSN